ncbi:MAG: hypothetical protein IT446_10785 [Phycisphaerales bacterium]|jgi:hypothetical protein|nr:hypothetical protein [Phycisphaerales bacterium]
MSQSILDRLAGTLLTTARKRMDEMGQFYPFGGAVNRNGDVVEVNFNPPAQGRPVQEFIDHVQSRLAAGARGGEFTAAGLCLLGRAHVPPDKRVSDAVCLQLHAPGECVNLYLPYDRREKKLEYGELFRTAGRGNWFGDPENA